MASTLALTPRGIAGVELHPNPNPGLDNTGYGVVSSGSGNAFTASTLHSGGPSGTGYWRVVGSGTNSTVATVQLGLAIDVAPAQVVRERLWVRASAACDVYPVLRRFAGAGGTGSNLGVDGTTVTLVANTWTPLDFEYTVPSGVASIRCECRMPAASVVNGRAFDFDELSLVRVTADPDPDTASAAIFALGIKLEWEQRTIVHDVPGADPAPVTVRPAGPMKGTIRYLFAERETCRRAEIIHSRPGIITLTDTDWPGGGMDYVAQGELISELDPDTRRRWVLETGFTEVT